jgi:putative acetyltransferase
MIVGHVLFSRVTITSPGGATDALALAPLGVLKPYRRQGIGSRLVNAGLDHGRALGYRAVFVQGDPKYYGRFGFTPASTKGLAMPFPTVPDPDSMVLELMVGGLRGLSGSVDYPPPWDAFK